MASSVPGIPPSFDVFKDNQQSPQAAADATIPATSAVEQTHQLHAEGQSAEEIATNLGLSLAQVETDLGVTTTQTAAVPATASISIKA